MARGRHARPEGPLWPAAVAAVAANHHHRGARATDQFGPPEAFLPGRLTGPSPAHSLCPPVATPHENPSVRRRGSVRRGPLRSTTARDPRSRSLAALFGWASCWADLEACTELPLSGPGSAGSPCQPDLSLSPLLLCSYHLTLDPIPAFSSGGACFGTGRSCTQRLGCRIMITLKKRRGEFEAGTKNGDVKAETGLKK